MIEIHKNNIKIHYTRNTKRNKEFCSHTGTRFVILILYIIVTAVPESRFESA